MPIFVFGGSYSVSHTRENPFPLALGSPFGTASSAAFPSSAALFEKTLNTYLLFLIGCWFVHMINQKTHFVKRFFWFFQSRNLMCRMKIIYDKSKDITVWECGLIFNRRHSGLTILTISLIFVLFFQKSFWHFFRDMLKYSWEEIYGFFTDFALRSFIIQDTTCHP